MKKIYPTFAIIVFIVQFTYAQWTTSGTNIYNGNTGYVGIGTTTPGQTLDVWGTGLRFHSTLGNQSEILLRDGAIEDPKTASDVGSIIFNYYGYNGGGTYYRNFAIFNGKGAQLLQVTGSTGYVGIGTSSPSDKLVVNGNIRAILDPSAFPTKNISGFISLGYSGITGARNWSIRGVYQYANGVGLNADGGDIDLVKSQDGNTILGTKTDGTSLGNVLIGKTSQLNTGYLLDVAGNVRANSVVINTTGADFVFAPTYHLNSLANVKKYIVKNHHLPEIASAKEMQASGLNVGENQTKLLQKVEELTLYLIEKDKQIEAQNALLKSQQTLLLKIQQDEENLNKKVESILKHK